MSYILDALKKSDQQRQRGATPTLQTAQVTAASSRQSFLIYYGLLAAALLGAVVTIGGLHLWNAAEPLAATEPAASEPSTQSPWTAAPAPPEAAGTAMYEMPAPGSMIAAQPVPRVDAMKPVTQAAAGTGAASADAPLPERNDSAAGAARERGAVSLAELPLAIQQEIPAITVQLHAYSNTPGERLVNVNFRSLREGGYVTPDLKLEQITADGMIFSYKGYRFQRGIR